MPSARVAIAVRAKATLSEAIPGGVRTFDADAIEKSLHFRSGILAEDGADVLMRDVGMLYADEKVVVDLGNVLTAFRTTAYVDEIVGMVVLVTGSKLAVTDNFGGPFGGYEVAPDAPLQAINEHGWPVDGIITITNSGGLLANYDITLIGRSGGHEPEPGPLSIDATLPSTFTEGDTVNIPVNVSGGTPPYTVQILDGAGNPADLPPYLTFDGHRITGKAVWA